MVQQYSVLGKQYVLHETIGSGGFAKVKLATHLLTGDKVAIKIMDKRALGDDLPRVDVEISALKDLCHQNICRLYQVFEDDEKLFLVLEYCSGGELFDYIVKKDRLPEPEARHFFRQIISAVAFVHSKGYCHRDLKPENLLLTNDLQLKLIDFGLCANPQRGSKRFLETCCGSPAYAAPELIAGKAYFGNGADIWSMGVLLYALLCGFLPFEDENLPKMYEKIQDGKYAEPPWLSEPSRSFLRAMLQPDPGQRIKIEKLLCHPWVVKDYTQPLKFQSVYNRQIDGDCALELASHLGINFDQAVDKINEWKYDYLTVTYYVLFNRKRKGQPVVLPPSAKSYMLSTAIGESGANILRSPTFHASLEIDLHKVERKDFADDLANHYSDSIKHSYRKAVNNVPTLLSVENSATPSVQKIRTCKSPNIYAGKENTELPAVFQVTPINVKRLTVQCYSGEFIDGQKEGETMEKPSLTLESTPLRNSTKVSAQTDNVEVSLRETPARPTDRSTKSCDYRNGPASATVSSPPPEWRSSVGGGTVVGDRTPRSAARSTATRKFSRRVFNSVERRVDRVINLLTPKKYRNGEKDAQPAIIGDGGSNIANISTTSSMNAAQVRDELLRVFQSKGISCKQKGWVIRGEAKDAHGRKTLTLELEVVRVGRLDMVGVKRKRLNGDSFMYKRICEDVLNLASL